MNYSTKCVSSSFLTNHRATLICEGGPIKTARSEAEHTSIKVFVNLLEMIQLDDGGEVTTH